MSARGAVLVPLLLAAAVVPRASFAQLSADATLGTSLQSLDSAAASTADGRGAFVGSAEVGVAFSEEKGYLSYSLDRGEYAQPGDWSFLQQRLGGRYRFDLGSGGWRLHVGADGTARQNGTEWQTADYDGLGAFANLEGRLSGLTLRTGYRFDARSFAWIPSLDQKQHDGFASLLLNLPSRTTLIAEAHAGAKSYEGEATILTQDVEVPPGTVLPVGVGGYGGGGRGMGPSLRPTTTTTTTTTTTITTYTIQPPTGDVARQYTLLGRIAQSLDDRTGLSFQAAWRTTSGQVPPTVVATPAGFFDDGVYDDPFASDMVALQARLKHVRPGGASFQLTGRHFDQSFVSALALDASGVPLPGEPLREDEIWRADATASLPLFPAKTGRFTLALELGYSFTHSLSNDAFYDYDSHAGGFALSIGY